MFISPSKKLICPIKKTDAAAAQERDRVERRMVFEVV
jgi:hypothetical protein